jgi:HK97 family phage major capsid protein
MPATLDRLRSDFTATQTRYRTLEELIAGEDRDPSEIEQGELDAMAARLRSLQPSIEEAVELERSLAAGATALASLPVLAPPQARGRQPQRDETPAERFRSWGDLAHAIAIPGQVQGDDYSAIRELMLQAELRRAFVDVVTADVPGILPPIWITDIAETINASRPFVNLFSTRPLPDVGMVLNYPRITQRPLVGKQATEKTEIPSRKTTIAQATANVATYGGGEDVSVQVLQRTEPSYLSLMLQLYAEQMAIVMDTDVITQALTAITTTAVTLSAAAPAAWNSLLANAIGDMIQASRLMPDVFVAGTDLWAAFAGASDADGRPLFPNVNAFNPVGVLSFTSTTGEVRGLTFAVDPNMPPTQGVIGNRNAFTTFVGGYQTMSADNPVKLGVDYAVFEFAAFAARRPDAAIKVVLGA